MLVLTRKLMEKLYIGDDICVTVVRLDSGQVRLGIEAPREVAVVRAELVPDRANPARGRAAHRGESRVPGQNGDGREFKTPPVLVHGIDSRRRGQSR